MTIKNQLENSLKDALRSGDDVRKRTIRMALAAIKLAEVGKSEPLDDNASLAILQKEVKSRNESIAEAQRAGRQDLVEATQAEIVVLNAFLPRQLSNQELLSLAQEVITEFGAVSPPDMGKVMKALLPRVQGRASGDQVSQAVRQLLQKTK
jgi:uncharacterized protein YqeY